MVNISITILSLILFSSCFMSGERADNQTSLSAEDYAVVNPRPIGEYFAKQNNNHKVLVGIIDTGVDYNHPLLSQNMHYELDRDGNPLGLGYDFVGDDPWPTPYLAKSFEYNPLLTAEDIERQAEMFTYFDRVTTYVPELIKYAPPRRNVIQENMAGVYHGTHVAGLIVNNRPFVGLLPYRVSPTEVYNHGDQFSLFKAISKKILKGMEKAVNSKARIINISMGFSLRKEEDKVSDPHYPELVTIAHDLRNFILNNQDVLFVIATGNDGNQEINQEDYLTTPCGVKAENILCVGSINDEGEISAFSNIYTDIENLVFAPGEKKLSTIPSKMCVPPSGLLMSFASELDDLLTSSEGSWKAHGNFVFNFCESQKSLKRISGTSMATPMVVGFAADILNKDPELSPKEVISLIKGKSELVDGYHILKLDGPRW